MSEWRRVMLGGAALALAACADPTGVAIEDDAGWDAIPSPHLVRSESQTRKFERRILTYDGASALSETQDVAFWAVHGRRSVVRIDTRDEEGDIHRLLKFDIPRYGLLARPDGTVIGEGDSVLITLAVDPERLLVFLEPSGLTFNPESPPRLTMWYAVVGRDFDRDGDEDDGDRQIRDFLGIWYQPDRGQPWEYLKTRHLKKKKALRVELNHFSNYTVSW